MATASKAMAGGFFGCLGVVGAVIALIVVLAVIGNLTGGKSGAFEGRDYLNACAVVTDDAERGFKVRGVKPSIDPPQLLDPGPTMRINCPATSSRGAILIAVQVNCGNVLEASCQTVYGVTRGGAAVPRR